MLLKVFPLPGYQKLGAREDDDDTDEDDDEDDNDEYDGAGDDEKESGVSSAWLSEARGPR